MPIYVDGRKLSGASSDIDIGTTYERILKLLRESPQSLGDIRRYSDRDMVYIRRAMAAIAAEIVQDMLTRDLLAGLDMGKVFDVFVVKASWLKGGNEE
jgi:hypothetical protein